MEGERSQADAFEREALAIEALPAELGFQENEELRRMRPHLVEAMIAGDFKELVTAYYTLGQQIVEQQQGEDFIKAQIGLSLTMALIRRDAGRIDAYIEDLADVLDSAAGMGYDNVVSLLQKTHNEAREARG